MPKPKKPRFIVELPLDTSTEDERLFNDRLLVGSRLTNVAIQHGHAVVDAMRADPAWAAAHALPRRTETQREARQEAFKAVRQAHGFSKASFESVLIAHKNAAGFSKRIGAHETQKLAERVFDTFNRWVLGKGGRPRFKSKLRPLHSLEGKNNKTMLQWKPDTLALQVEAGWQVPVKKPNLQKDEWLWYALSFETCYCRLVWRRVNGRKRWYVQLIQEGVVPVKASVLMRIAQAGSAGGLDIGPSNIAWCTDTDAGLIKFCAEVDRPHDLLRTLQRQLDRQRRANNPDNFHPDGRCKQGRRTWVASKRQRKTELALEEAYRQEAAARKNAHGCDTNTLMSQARSWREDDVSVKGLQQRYGKSISVRAPGLFRSELERKAERAGGNREAIDVRALKNSQYDHSTNTFTKKKLSERWHVFGDGRGRVQRDVYSAFLALNSQGKTYDPPALETAWSLIAPVLMSRGLYVATEAKASVAETASEGCTAREGNYLERLSHLGDGVERFEHQSLREANAALDNRASRGGLSPTSAFHETGTPRGERNRNVRN